MKAPKIDPNNPPPIPKEWESLGEEERMLKLLQLGYSCGFRRRIPIKDHHPMCEHNLAYIETIAGAEIVPTVQLGNMYGPCLGTKGFASFSHLLEEWTVD